MNVSQKDISVNSPIVKGIRSGQFQDKPIKTSIVIEMNKMVPYKATKKDSEIVLSLLPDSENNEITDSDNLDKILEEQAKEEEIAVTKQPIIKENPPVKEQKKPVKQVKPKAAQKKETNGQDKKNTELFSQKPR